MLNLPRDLLASAGGRRLVFASLYLSEGAPIGYIWWALPTRLRAAGVPVEDVSSIVALLALPWAFKFFWAPLVDTLRFPRWGLRSWIVSAQLLMGLTLIPLPAIATTTELRFLTILLAAHATFAAFQDVSVDTYAIARISPIERGAINGWMQVGMLTGRAFFGGVSLMIERWIGETAVIALLISCIWWSTFLVLWCAPAAGVDPARLGAGDRLASFGRRLRGALTRPSTWFGLAFAAVAGAGFESVGAVAGPFLVDGGMTEGRIGMFFAGPALACMAIGALIGGRLADRLPRARAAGLLLLTVAASVVCVAVSTRAGATASIVALSAMYLSVGAFTATSYALFMDLTDVQLGATQFSAFMGATNLCEAWSAFAVGRLIARYDYTGAFVAMAAVSLTALPLVCGLRASAAGSPPSTAEDGSAHVHRPEV